MTLENCNRLLKFYETGKGTLGLPGYIAPQPKRAAEMKAHITYKISRVSPSKK